MAKPNRTHYTYFGDRKKPPSFFRRRVILADRHYYDGDEIEDIGCKIPNGIRPKERIFILYDDGMTKHENNWKQAKTRKQYEWHIKPKNRHNKHEKRYTDPDEMNMDQILFEDYGSAA